MNWPSLLKWLAAYEDENAFAYLATKSSSEGEKAIAGAFDIVDHIDGVDWEMVVKVLKCCKKGTKLDRVGWSGNRR